MTPGVSEAASARLYGRLWQILIEWFRVPAEPPSLPAVPGERVTVFHPSPGYLRYRKLWFWILLTAVDIPLIALWALILIRVWWVGLLLAPIFVALIIVPDLLAFVAIHLRYDTLWYALSERSMRIRHGLWVIHEKTITFENVQNLTVEQGPVERRFGIARVTVQTAGGGGDDSEEGAGGHRAEIEGVDNAPEIRDLIMDRVRHSTPGGAAPPTETWLWTPGHVAVLREIRDRLRPEPEGSSEGWRGRSPPKADAPGRRRTSIDRAHSGARVRRGGPEPRPPGSEPEGIALERGLWRVAARLLRLPQDPPELPGGDQTRQEVFLPAPAYLRYLRWEAMGTTFLVAAVAAVGGLVLLLLGRTPSGRMALVAAPVVLVIGALLTLLARLRFRTMWYALDDRSLRARHGVWTVEEVTITYENVQNISVTQGPLMRLFGVWQLDIQTAGGGRRRARAGNPMATGLLVAFSIVASLLPGGAAFGNVGGRRSKRSAAATGTIHGLLDPHPVRNRIMERVRQSRSAGFGDDWDDDGRPPGLRGRAVTREHVRALRSIAGQVGV